MEENKIFYKRIDSTQSLYEDLIYVSPEGKNGLWTTRTLTSF